LLLVIDEPGIDRWQGEVDLILVNSQKYREYWGGHRKQENQSLATSASLKLMVSVYVPIVRHDPQHTYPATRPTGNSAKVSFFSYRSRQKQFSAFQQ
jgi:Holliday junction resolvase RusA-like endonuclease